MALASRPIPKVRSRADCDLQGRDPTGRFTSNLPEALRPASICSATRSPQGFRASIVTDATPWPPRHVRLNGISVAVAVDRRVRVDCHYDRSAVGHHCIANPLQMQRVDLARPLRPQPVGAFVVIYAISASRSFLPVIAPRAARAAT